MHSISPKRCIISCSSAHDVMNLQVHKASAALASGQSPGVMAALTTQRGVPAAELAQHSRASVDPRQPPVSATARFQKARSCWTSYLSQHSGRQRDASSTVQCQLAWCSRWPMCCDADEPCSCHGRPNLVQPALLAACPRLSTNHVLSCITLILPNAWCKKHTLGSVELHSELKHSKIPSRVHEIDYGISMHGQSPEAGAGRHAAESELLPWALMLCDMSCAAAAPALHRPLRRATPLSPRSPNAVWFLQATRISEQHWPVLAVKHTLVTK